MSTPLVSVIMPVHNAAPYLAAAMTSVLQQSCTDWELLAVDDASEDASLGVAREFAGRDRRIRVESLPCHGGTAVARNAAIAQARGKYLAFLDADDCALPSRFDTQLRVVAQAPPGALACSAAALIDSADAPAGLSRFPGPAECVLPMLLFHNVITNSSVLTLREGFIGFQSGYEPAEDYDAWLRAAPRATVLYSRRPLISYRVHAGSVSASSQERMTTARQRIAREALARLGAPADAETVGFHLAVADGTIAPTLASLNRAEEWLLTLRDANRSSSLFQEDALARVLSTHWHAVCHRCWTVPEEAAKRLSASPLAGPLSARLPPAARLRLRGVAARYRRKTRGGPLL